VVDVEATQLVGNPLLPLTDRLLGIISG